MGTAIEWQVAYDLNRPIFYFEFKHDRTALRRWITDDYDIDRHVKRQRGATSIRTLAELRVQESANHAQPY